MRLDHTIFIGEAQVHESGGAEHTPDLAENSGRVRDVLVDVIEDDNVARLVRKGQRRTVTT
jgi:hypothetical protein